MSALSFSYADRRALKPLMATFAAGCIGLPGTKLQAGHGGASRGLADRLLRRIPDLRSRQSRALLRRIKGTLTPQSLPFGPVQSSDACGELLQAFHVLLLVPFLISLAMLPSLTALAPVSTAANLCNIIGMVVVLWDDLASFQHHETVVPFTSVANLPFMFGEQPMVSSRGQPRYCV